MPRRIDVELTSERPDGTWTWRAAGAREPRGELDGGLLPSGAKVGDILRAEADFDIDGITVTAVLAPKAEDKPGFERLEILGPQREFQPVTSTLVGRGDRDRDRGDRRGPRRDRPDRPDRADRPDRPDRRDRPERRERAPRTSEPRGERPPRAPRRERPAPPPPLPERPKPKRLRPGRAHRDEFLGSLSPERRLIAEQLLKGGIPAVRTALDEQNAKARAEGAPEVPTANILQVAEDLMPATRIADWLDKADAAVADLEELSLADLRAVVASAGDVAREERTRELATTLREALDRRSVAEQEQWVGDVKLSLEHGRVVRALRLASRPPEPTQVLPDEVLTQLATAAGAGMTSEIGSDRFATMLDAVAYSPVRREVEPAGVPAEPGAELLAAVRKHAGRTPTIAKLFGIEPPPPAPAKGARRARPERPRSATIEKPKAGGPPVDVGGRKIPPPPRPVAKPLAPPPPGAPSAPEVEAEPGAPVDATDAPPVVPSEPDAPPTPSGEAVADAAAAASAGEVEVVEQVERAVEDEVAGLDDATGSDVPPGDGEGASGLSGTPAVVEGVADEDDV